ncbi:MAG: hypothetical protein ACE5E5_04925 [Phycisphaerae bacterium]
MTIETRNGVIIGPTVGPCRAEPAAAQYAATSSRILLLIAAIIGVFWIAYQALSAIVADSNIAAGMIAW